MTTLCLDRAVALGEGRNGGVTLALARQLSAARRAVLADLSPPLLRQGAHGASGHSRRLRGAGYHLRRGAEAARGAHNPEVTGSSPVGATNLRVGTATRRLLGNRAAGKTARRTLPLNDVAAYAVPRLAGSDTPSSPRPAAPAPPPDCQGYGGSERRGDPPSPRPWGASLIRDRESGRVVGLLLPGAGEALRRALRSNGFDLEDER